MPFGKSNCTVRTTRTIINMNTIDAWKHPTVLGEFSARTALAGSLSRVGFNFRFVEVNDSFANPSVVCPRS